MMENKDCNKLFQSCRRKCTCNNYKSSIERLKRSEVSHKYGEDQKTFINFLIELVSVIAFIFFGSVVFWLSVGGMLLDFFKKLCYSDRCVQHLAVGLITFLLLSMTVRISLNKRACREPIIHHHRDLGKRNVEDVTNASEPLKKPQEYFKIGFKENNLQNTFTGDTNIIKTFTLTIVNENKKEVFKTSQDFIIPQIGLEMKKPPALVVYLKELILENY